MNFFPARKGENPLSLAQMEKSCYLCASFQKIAKDGTTKPGAKIHNFYLTPTIFHKGKNCDSVKCQQVNYLS